MAMIKTLKTLGFADFSNQKIYKTLDEAQAQVDAMNAPVPCLIHDNPTCPPIHGWYVSTQTVDGGYVMRENRSGS